MTWSDVIKWGLYVAAPAFMAGGAITAVIQGWFGKPYQRALSKRETALADAAKTDSSVEMVNVWMKGVILSNEKLTESNERLQKSNDRLRREVDQVRGVMHREVGQARREMNDMRDVMRSLVSVVERFMPLLRQAVDSEEEIALLNQALAQARSVNGGQTQ